MSDDDLPVLTRVLRTGNASVTPLDPASDDGFQDRFDVHPFDDGPLTRQIVIGHEPALVRTGPLTAMSIYDDDPLVPDDRAAVEPPAVAHDAFALSQDVDAHGPGAAGPIDAPPLSVSATAPTSATRIDTPLDFSVPSDTAAWAARVRESVMFDLVARIDTELDARIAQALRVEVETALAQLHERLRSHLTDALRDVVARAVGEEIVRIRQSGGDDAGT